MQTVLSGPEVMSSVQRLDLEALGNNPKIKRLMNNARIRAIQSDVNWLNPVY